LAYIKNDIPLRQKELNIWKYTEIKQRESIKLKMRRHKLRSGVN